MCYFLEIVWNKRIDQTENMLFLLVLSILIINPQPETSCLIIIFNLIWYYQACVNVFL